MKKNIRNLIIGLSILVTVIVIFSCYFLFNLITKEKIKITADEFFNKMQEKEYIIADAKSQFLSYDYIEKVYVATPSDYSYKIEFYEMKDIESAKGFYETNKRIFEEGKKDGYIETNNNLKNSSRYTIKNNEKYSVISRIDNTAIYINSDIEYANEIDKFLKQIGY
ncbi:MAG: hypothetical protein HFJ50_00140 [Clostridia bacterium]|jgi:hypothetical protein|nr:hypothetical protein [Clostridia bacterium]